MRSLENRVALVSGSSSGIGQAIAVKLAQAGTNIIINYAGHSEGAEETLEHVEAAGAHGIVIPERRAAGLTDAVARASAGALAHLPVAKVTNLVRAMEDLKEAGYWLIGLDETAEKSYTEVDYTTPTGIVMGGEGNGLHELTRKRCDFVVSLPTSGPVKSLNVSVATGVVLFEALRQRTARR